VQKRPIILSILLTVATPYSPDDPHYRIWPTPVCEAQSVTQRLAYSLERARAGAVELTNRC